MRQEEGAGRSGGVFRAALGWGGGRPRAPRALKCPCRSGSWSLGALGPDVDNHPYPVSAFPRGGPEASRGAETSSGGDDVVKTATPGLAQNRAP